MQPPKLICFHKNTQNLHISSSKNVASAAHAGGYLPKFKFATQQSHEPYSYGLRMAAQTKIKPNWVNKHNQRNHIANQLTTNKVKEVLSVRMRD